MRWWLFAIVTGCGRIGFDPTTGSTPGDDGNGPGSEAGVVATSPCAASQPTPDQIAFTGKAILVNFAGGMSPESGVDVAMIDSSGATIAQDTTTANGTFSIQVTTGGAPFLIRASATKANRITTVLETDGTVDGDVDKPDLYVAQASTLTSIYLAGGVNRNANGKGSLGVQVVDCSGAVIEGAEVTLSPAPEKMVYTDSNGFPSGSQASTTAPFGLAIGLNALPGTTMITATHPARQFNDVTVEVHAGDFLTQAPLRPVN